MKYILKTEINANGNKVFSKERRGHQFIYLAKDENGKIGKVDKAWILKNKANIINLAVSGESLIVYENVEKKKSSFNLAKETAQVVKGFYSVTERYQMTPDFESDNETSGVYEFGLGSTHVNHEFNDSVSGFDLNAVYAEYKNMNSNWNYDYELVECTNYLIESTRISDAEDVRDFNRSLSITINEFDKHKQAIENIVYELKPWFEKWSDLCGRYGKDEIIELLENEFSIQELV